MSNKKWCGILAVAALAAGTQGAFAQEADMSGVDMSGSCKIGFSQGTLNHPWRVAMVEGNRQYAEKDLPNVELIITDGQNSSAKQVTDVESLMAQGIDILMISPLTAQALTPVVQEVMDAGTPVVTLDREVNTPVTLHVGADNVPIAQQAARFIADKLGGKGNIVQIEGTAGSSAAIDRKQGFEEVIAEYPDLKIVATQNADFLRENALKFMEDVLQRFGPGEIDAVYAHNDEMALGAITALEAAGRQDEVVVTGIDGQNNAIQAVKDGKLLATFTFPYVAPQGVQYTYQVCMGKEFEADHIVLGSDTITAENADAWIGKGF